MQLTPEDFASDPVEGFDGGLYQRDGRRYVVATTHGWALRLPDGDWDVPVAFSPQEPEPGEPHTYVMQRDRFLSLFDPVPDE
jgi:hypothetical protein